MLFAPPVSEIYPDGFATTVQVAGLSEVLEGAERGPGHFAGVCTVVNKLLNIVGPDVAYFGQKDAQQVAVVKRMVRDLDMPVRIEVLPTVREPDGLALSSRNVRLSPEDRARALGALARAAAPPRDAVAAGERDAERIRAAALAELGDVEPEYLAIVDPLTFAPLPTVGAPHARRGRGAGRPRPPDRQHRPRTRPGGDRLSRRQPHRRSRACPPPPRTSASASRSPSSPRCARWASRS